MSPPRRAQPRRLGGIGTGRLAGLRGLGNGFRDAVLCSVPAPATALPNTWHFDEAEFVVSDAGDAAPTAGARKPCPTNGSSTIRS